MFLDSSFKETKNNETELSTTQIFKEWNCLQWKTKNGERIIDILLNEGYNTAYSLFDLTTNDLKKYNIQNKYIKQLFNNIQTLRISNESTFFNSTICIPNKTRFKDIKLMKNPYTIIVGISDYKQCNKSGNSDLYATINDTKRLKQLFSKVYGYTNIVAIQDFIDKDNKHKINVENFHQFLLTQRDNINKLCNNKNNLNKPDGLLFFFNGHGNKHGIMVGDGNTYEYNSIQNIFSNSKLQGLCTLPKLLYFDNCRGSMKTRPINLNNNNNNKKIGNNRNNSRTIENENENNIIYKNNTTTNKYNDMVITFSTILGTKSYDNNKNGHLTKSLYCIYKDLKFMKDNTLYDASLRIKALVNYYSKHNQTCEVVSRLDYNVKLLSRNEQTNNNLNYSFTQSKSDNNENNEEAEYVKKSGILSITDFNNMYWSLKDKLGIGSFSLVTKVTRKKDFRQCAFKVTSSSNALFFEKEIKILEECNHINIIKLINYVGEYENRLCMVLEYCEGGTLLNRLKTSSFPEIEVCNIIKQVTNGLKYLHRLGIVHRDIKPSNLMYATRKRQIVKIIDFGLVEKIDNDKLLTTKCGTIYYMAPEIFNNLKYDSSVDMWALGVTMYVLLSQELPFNNYNKEKLIESIKSGKYSFSNPKWNFITQPCKQLIKQLLIKYPKSRLTAKDAVNNPWLSMLKYESLGINYSEQSITDTKSEKLYNFLKETNYEHLFSQFYANGYQSVKSILNINLHQLMFLNMTKLEKIELMHAMRNTLRKWKKKFNKDQKDKYFVEGLQNRRLPRYSHSFEIEYDKYYQL